MKGIKEKNFCDKCKKMTWHKYKQSTKISQGYTLCLECKNKRIL